MQYCRTERDHPAGHQRSARQASQDTTYPVSAVCSGERSYVEVLRELRAPLVPGAVETVENMEEEIRRMMSSDPTFMTEMFSVMQRLAEERRYARGREDIAKNTARLHL